MTITKLLEELRKKNHSKIESSIEKDVCYIYGVLENILEHLQDIEIYKDEQT